MSSLDLARWQFGVTTIYHFLFVPITIGITWFVAIFQTLWYRRGDEHYLRLTRFFGKLMLINFAIGVVTGIVQEFQFGMNWVAYSRYVGDIFGAPLAMEGLAAFFLESTFLGLWIFGWGRLPPRLHLATIYAVAFGTTLSRVLHPRRQLVDAAPGRVRDQPRDRPRRDDVDRQGADELDAAVRLPAHDRRRRDDGRHARRRRLGVAPRARLERRDVRACRSGIALPVVFVAALLHDADRPRQAQLMTKQQPMKMAAAEALYKTQTGAPFSLFAVAPFEHKPARSTFDITLPHGLSVLSTNTWNGKVEGINDLNARVPGEVRAGRLRARSSASPTGRSGS